MIAEQKDQPMQSLKYKLLLIVPQDITITIATSTQQIDVHERLSMKPKAKLKKLDIWFAASVVGDGSNGITRPFENALSQIPL
jgi:hypothetical protein